MGGIVFQGMHTIRSGLLTCRRDLAEPCSTLRIDIGSRIDTPQNILQWSGHGKDTKLKFQFGSLSTALSSVEQFLVKVEVLWQLKSTSYTQNKFQICKGGEALSVYLWCSCISQKQQQIFGIRYTSS